MTKLKIQVQNNKIKDASSGLHDQPRITALPKTADISNNIICFNPKKEGLYKDKLLRLSYNFHNTLLFSSNLM